ncbi:uncharacterized protein LOC129734579 [Falco cherrug]|uniref:uncharacterized protein LOC129734579 n=1 Tax=Falco cherrug TaxID=345164 RepID=UPI00247B260D|nr:uncharacterized protein LOC129734579 [Falco cherrug]
MLRIVVLINFVVVVVAFVPKSLFDLRENVWVTLSRAVNTTTFCASLSTPSVPFLTCLVGVPLNDSDWIALNQSLNQMPKVTILARGNNMSSFFEKFDNWDDKLPIGPSPQEIELVDSLNASYCVYLNSSRYPCAGEASNMPCSTTAITPVYPIKNQFNWSVWCNHTSRNLSNPAPGVLYPRKLPPGLFFICGNRAWNGIPSMPVGGPCTIGRLSLALPHIHPNKSNPVRWRRDTSQILGNTCDDNVQLWNKWEVFFASLFIPGAAAARAHKNLETLSCWVVKQANLSSRVLSDLADSLTIVQHAVLQNRMAIDFLLLAHGHGCEDFEGMCCMDLEDNSSSIHKEIKQLMEHSQKIQQDVGFFGLESLTNWLGIGGWLKRLLQSVLLIVIIVIIGFICLSCALSCIRKLFERITGPVFLVQKEKGGIVAEWMKENGHGSIEGLCDTAFDISLE